MTIFFSVGEPSGDLHGANLINQLKARSPQLRFVGYGGPRMASAGCELHADLTQLAIMWFLRVLLNIHKFIGYARRADQYFVEHRPDAVVLIDYPGFNWWIARRAKRRGIPVFYYGTPQIWAWAGWRIKKMRRFVDHALCKLPFEEDWYRQQGCNATYVGHPYFDELRARRLDADFVASQSAKPGRLVTILPGSRNQEVEANLADLLRAAHMVQESTPDVRFAIAAFKQQHADKISAMLSESSLAAEVHVGRTPELISVATCAMAVSGSVSLELLYHAKPAVILYRISRLGYFVQGIFRKVRYITLVNLLTTDDLFPAKVGGYKRGAAEDAHVLMPEYLTHEDRTDEIASHIHDWLSNDQERKDVVEQLEGLRDRIGAGGASERAAGYILQELTNPGGQRQQAA